MALRRIAVSLISAAALALPGTAHAVGGNYAVEGGTTWEQTQVRSALEVSAFDWSVVPREITIRIAPGVDSRARPGEIWLDADLLDAGRFSWGVVQHEYAHEVDFSLLTPTLRVALLDELGATTWWESCNATHRDAGSERFASTLAWSYWPSRDNVMRPTSWGDESAALPPAQFRALAARLLLAPPVQPLAYHR